MCPTTGPITSVVNLDPPPFRQLVWDIVSGCCDGDLLIERVRAASCYNQVDELALKSGVDGECPLQVQQRILGIC
jgi:hypothetical protein